jgi:hypothetical protein
MATLRQLRDSYASLRMRMHSIPVVALTSSNWATDRNSVAERFNMECSLSEEFCSDAESLFSNLRLKCNLIKTLAQDYS